MRRRPPPVAAFVELGKLNVFELWFGIPVAWTLLSQEEAFSPRTLLLLALALLLKAATSSAALALDDVSGLRDGLDLRNYGDTDRYAVHKPLIDGRLSERQALAFAWLAVGIGLLSMAAAFAVAWPLPSWLVAGELLVFILALNYSYGLKLSYRGAGELITAVAVGSTLLVPYALVAGGASTAALVQSGLIGLWMLQIAVFSNSQDRAGDRDARRWTVAAMASARGNAVFILCVFAASAALLAWGIRLGVLGPWLLVALLPALALQARQIWLGVARGQWLAARLLGFEAFRLAVAALLVVNLVVRAR